LNLANALGLQWIDDWEKQVHGGGCADHDFSLKSRLESNNEEEEVTAGRNRYTVAVVLIMVFVADT